MSLSPKISAWQKKLAGANAKLSNFWSFSGDEWAASKRRATIANAEVVLRAFKRVAEDLRKKYPSEFEYELEYFEKQIQERLSQIKQFQSFRSYYEFEEKQAKRNAVKHRREPLSSLSSLEKKIQKRKPSSINYKELLIQFEKGLNKINDDLYAATQGDLKDNERKRAISRAQDKIEAWEKFRSLLQGMQRQEFENSFENTITDMKNYLQKLQL